jgi:uncharacterized protein
MKDKELACLFANCLPNTLDTTVLLHSPPSKDLPSGDSFLITGDILAMWLRDSCNQVLPYMRFLGQDDVLRGLVKGLVHRQATQVLTLTYPNPKPWPSLTIYARKRRYSRIPGPMRTTSIR